MNVEYRTGKQMPENVFEALKFAGKVGVLTKPAWNELFSRGNDRWQRRQILNLKEDGYLLDHTCGIQLQSWVLSPWSQAFLRSHGYSSVAPIPPHLIEHDVTLATGIWKLKEKNLCQNWMTERELKIQDSRQFVIEKTDRFPKFPDALIQLENVTSLIAFEYERTGKSSSRYRKILAQYARLPEIYRICYITEDAVIRERIQSAIRNLGKPDLSERIVFVSAHEWRADPVDIFRKAMTR